MQTILFVQFSESRDDYKELNGKRDLSELLPFFSSLDTGVCQG